MTDIRRTPHSVLAVSGTLAVLAAGCHAGGHRNHHGHMDHRFKDANSWAEKFEDPKRDEWQKPDYVLSVLDLRARDTVADIGSATGYFPVRFARACPDGMVFGMDIEADMVRYLNDRAAREGLTNLKSIQCTSSDLMLPHQVDVLFTCNTNHHIPDRVAYFRRSRSLLRPGGRLVNVDWNTNPRPIGPPPEHSLPADAAIGEMKEAGFKLIKRDDTLPYQYILVFEVDR